MLLILEDLERRNGDRLYDDWPFWPAIEEPLEDGGGDLDLDITLLFPLRVRVGVRKLLDMVLLYLSTKGAGAWFAWLKKNTTPTNR